MITQEQLAKLLKRDVTPRMVEIWNGVGIPPEKAEAFRQMWAKQSGLDKPEVTPTAGTFRPTEPRKPCGCKKPSLG